MLQAKLKKATLSVVFDKTCPGKIHQKLASSQAQAHSHTIITIATKNSCMPIPLGFLPISES